MARAQIIGTGGYQPGEAIPTSKIQELVGELPPEVAEGLSIEKRYWLIDTETGRHEETNADMALKAVNIALETAGVEADEVDLLVGATGTPDYHLPAGINFVQEGLGPGVDHCSTLELRSGGAGFVQGLDIARFYLEQGSHKTAVVVGSEAISPVLAPVFVGVEPKKIRIRDRMPLYMFGDGAAAAVVRATDDDNAPGLIGGASKSVGGQKKPGIWSVGGGVHAPIADQIAAKRLVDLRVDAVGAGDFTPYMVTQALADTLQGAGVDADSIDHCLIPEGNVGWLLDSLRDEGLFTPEWQAMEGKIFDNLAQMGACGCAAVPLFLDHAWKNGLITPGQRVMLIGVEATKWIYGGLVLDWTAEAPAG